MAQAGEKGRVKITLERNLIRNIPELAGAIQMLEDVVNGEGTHGKDHVARTALLSLLAHNKQTHIEKEKWAVTFGIIEKPNGG